MKTLYHLVIFIVITTPLFAQTTEAPQGEVPLKTIIDVLDDFPLSCVQISGLSDDDAKMVFSQFETNSAISTIPYDSIAQKTQVEELMDGAGPTNYANYAHQLTVGSIPVTVYTMISKLQYPTKEIQYETWTLFAKDDIERFLARFTSLAQQEKLSDNELTELVDLAYLVLEMDFASMQIETITDLIPEDYDDDNNEFDFDFGFYTFTVTRTNKKMYIDRDAGIAQNMSLIITVEGESIALKK